jgi:flagellar biosynthetic protein FliP
VNRYRTGRWIRVQRPFLRGRDVGRLTTWLLVLSAWAAPVAWAQSVAVPRVTLAFGAAEEPQDLVLSLQVIILLTILALAPSILVLLTSFTRTVVVLSFTRTALGTNQMPPNQVLIGLALFLTLFTMAPTLQQINSSALQPYLAGELEFRAAGQLAERPLRAFMLQHTREKDLHLFLEMAGDEPPADPHEVGAHVLIPAFVISELKSAFQMGFVLYIPFIVIDMIVASVLLSLGMMMLPPMMISLPLKILLFVLADGWHLVVRSILLSYQVGGVGP